MYVCRKSVFLLCRSRARYIEIEEKREPILSSLQACSWLLTYQGILLKYNKIPWWVSNHETGLLGWKYSLSFFSLSQYIYECIYMNKANQNFLVFSYFLSLKCKNWHLLASTGWLGKKKLFIWDKQHLLKRFYRQKIMHEKFQCTNISALEFVFFTVSHWSIPSLISALPRFACWLIIPDGIGACAGLTYWCTFVEGEFLRPQFTINRR